MNKWKLKLMFACFAIAIAGMSVISCGGDEPDAPTKLPADTAVTDLDSAIVSLPK